MAFAIFSLPIFLSILFFIICFLVILAIVKFTLYIFQSFGLLNIAKKEGYKYRYISWIPGLSHYILGKFCLKKNLAIIYTILTVINILLFVLVIFIENSILFYLFLVFTILYFVIDMLVMNKFYKKVYKTPEIFTIFTIITFGFLKPIFIYTSRIKKITNEY